MDHITRLKNKGYRITAARSSIISLFEKNLKPVSPTSIHNILQKIGVFVNITTVYREIDFLLENNIIEKVPLKDSELYYELKDREHHHHLMCSDCGVIEDIVLESEKTLLEEAHSLSNFEINRHSIAFFGKCKKCQ